MTETLAAPTGAELRTVGGGSATGLAKAIAAGADALMLGSPLAAEACGKLRVRLSKNHHQPRHEPARDYANLLDQTFLDPEEQLIRFLQHSTRRHSETSPAMPT